VPPQIIAHRGASHAERENTVAAFRRAGATGADAVELDVRVSIDGELVVHHDAELPDGRLVHATASSDLPDFVPTLLEALDAAAGMWVNVEIKNYPGDPEFDPTLRVADATVALLADQPDPQRFVISCFHLETIDRCRELAPAIPTAYLCVDVPDDIVATLAARGHSALHPWDPTVTADLIAACHAGGLAVNTWTCDDADRMAELIGWGVDGICTNDPDVAVAVRASVLG
jgi:glycerophosphoryl diester phosphodiesterase